MNTDLGRLLLKGTRYGISVCNAMGVVTGKVSGVVI